MREELLVAAQKGKEAQKSGGGRQVGVLSRWVVARARAIWGVEVGEKREGSGV